MTAKYPQPGEYWRVHIRPVEWDCPQCNVPLEIGGNANNNMIVRIVEKVQDSFVHIRHGCNKNIPLPEGWVWYTTREQNGDKTFYTLPYTLFEPEVS